MLKHILIRRAFFCKVIHNWSIKFCCASMYLCFRMKYIFTWFCKLCALWVCSTLLHYRNIRSQYVLISWTYVISISRGTNILFNLFKCILIDTTKCHEPFDWLGWFLTPSPSFSLCLSPPPPPPTISYSLSSSPPPPPLSLSLRNNNLLTQGV